MEHREPPRLATAPEPSEDMRSDPARARRFARFVTPPSVRRLSRTRIVLALLACAGLLYFLPMAGSYGLRSLRNFVHEQPEYQVRFGDIRLEPPPPAWYLGGAKHLLERVRQEAREPERFSLLDLDPEQLKGAFRRNGWVRKASVEIANPNRVVVHLVYREPVALVQVDGSKEVLIDREAVILAREDVDLDAAAPLLLSRTRGKSPPPLDPRAGVAWKTANGPNGLPEVDECVLAGAKLADYLKSVQEDDLAQQHPGRFQAVVAETFEAKLRLWVQSGKHLLVLWGMPPGEEQPGELPATEKWKVLSQWQFDRTKIDPRNAYYFEFKGAKVVLTVEQPQKK